MEFIIGATAAVGAVIVSNPLDVIKTRLQLQGELKARGQYNKVYNNLFHGVTQIIKKEGLTGIQKGFIPAAMYQVVMNGTRLSLFQMMQDKGYLNDSKTNKLSSSRCAFAGAGVGVISGFIASPFYLAKVQLQSQADPSLAVGHQHQHKSVWEALYITFKNGGLTGLYRGATTSITRVGVGSTAQLFSFSMFRDTLHKMQVCDINSWSNALAGAMLSGVAVTACMAPFDVLSTRLYNQRLDSTGRGELYRGLFDCFLRVVRTEGPLALYKGWSAVYLRIGPHSFINLMLWDSLKNLYYKNMKQPKL